ncbi:fimbrial protein [Chromobacterium haemolyticum]|uniref:fimbrial protein n=1 Tax=Chromobacterium haemolyticum TaxID=394935 RepID=UPI00307D80F4
MNKLAIMVSLALGMGMASQTFAANRGEIVFKGSVATSTCLIDGQEDGYKVVDFNNLTPDQISTTGSAEVPFSLTVSGQSDVCNASRVQIAFNPNNQNVNKETGRLKLSGPSAASNLEIELYKGSGGSAVKIPLGSTNSADMPGASLLPVVPTEGPAVQRSANIPLSAKLQRVNTGTVPGSGAVFSQIDYVLAYQ